VNVSAVSLTDTTNFTGAITSGAVGPLAAGASITYSVACTPPASAAPSPPPYTATLSISHNDPKVADNPVTYDLTCNVIESRTDVFLILDRSGSMGEDAGYSLMKIERMRAAAKFFITRLDAERPGMGDKVGIVWFNNQSGILEPLQEITSPTQMDTGIDSLTQGGSTSIGGGLEEAFTVLENPAQSDAPRKVIVLLSDGKENMPPCLVPANCWSPGPQYVVPDTPETRIFTVGLGLASNINAQILSSLAFESVGTATAYFHVTQSDYESLNKFFSSIIGDTFDLYNPVDPEFKIGTGDTGSMDVGIGEADRSATFLAFWGSSSSDIGIELMRPGSTTAITPANAAFHGATYVKGDLYAFYKVPVTKATIGKWKMNVSGVDIPASIGKDKVRLSVMVASDLSFVPSLDKGVYDTGDSVHLSVRLLENGLPASAENMEVEVRKPLDGVGNVLSRRKVPMADLQAMLKASPDALPNMRYAKAAILTEKDGRPIIGHHKTTIRLYDDGNHGDGAAGDGIWANDFTGTMKEGVYDFYFKAQVRQEAGAQIAREKTVSTVIGVLTADAGKSRISVSRGKAAKAGVSSYQVKFTPKDRFGNHMGPGYAGAISMKAAKADLAGKIVDNADGSYSAVLQTSDTVKAGEIDVKLKVNESVISFNVGKKLSLWRKPAFWILLLAVLLVIAYVVNRRINP
jgi:hypothetical protein